MLTLDLVVVSTMSVYKATFNVGCACFFTMSIPDFFTYLITSKLLSKAAIFVSLYINCLLTLLYITALDNIIFHLDRFLSQTLSSWSLSHEHSVISLGIILM